MSLTREEFDKRLDDELCRLATGYTREDLELYSEEETGLDAVDTRETLEDIDKTKQALCQLVLDVIGKDHSIDRIDIAAGTDGIKRQENEWKTGLREIVKGDGDGS